jgi:hypothetical protein
MHATTMPMASLREVLEEALDKGTRADFRARGLSMSPTVRDGDVVTVRRVRSDELHLGDIVTFWRADQLVMHRVIEVGQPEADSSPGFRTAGDGNAEEDGIQPGDALLGRVVLVRGSRNDWSPDDPTARVRGLFRVALAKRPRLRMALRALRKRLRYLGLVPGQRVSA